MKNPADFPPLVSAMVRMKSLVVRPQLGPAERNPPVVPPALVVTVRVFCRNSKSIYASPLSLNRSPANTSHWWPSLVPWVIWISAWLISTLSPTGLLTHPHFELVGVLGLSLNWLPPAKLLSLPLLNRSIR